MGNIQVIRIATTTFNLSVISKNIVFLQKKQNIENQFLRLILARSSQTKYFSSNWTRVDKRLLFWIFPKRFYFSRAPPNNSVEGLDEGGGVKGGERSVKEAKFKKEGGLQEKKDL